MGRPLPSDALLAVARPPEREWTSLAPILEPDADVMLRHLQAVFGNAGDGLVELAWTDPETRRLARPARESAVGARPVLA